VLLYKHQVDVPRETIGGNEMSKEGRARVNITMSEDLKEWFQEYAEGFGIPMSGMMAIALAQYKQQVEGLGAVKELGALYAKMQEIEAKIEQSAQ
jgi:hypothetical protein